MASIEEDDQKFAYMKEQYTRTLYEALLSIYR